MLGQKPTVYNQSLSHVSYHINTTGFQVSRNVHSSNGQTLKSKWIEPTATTWNPFQKSTIYPLHAMLWFHDEGTDVRQQLCSLESILKIKAEQEALVYAGG